MFVCFDDFFYGQIKITREGHSVNDSKTTFGSALASFLTEIFHECCPFRNTPLPLRRVGYWGLMREQVAPKARKINKTNK